MLDRSVNIFKNAMDNKPEHKAPLSSVLRGIKEGKWRSEIEYMRKLNTEHGKKACDEPKKLLPAVSFSGTFGDRRASEELDVHTGIVQIDIDDCEDIPATRKKLEEDEHIVFVFLSPRGTGIKAGLRIPRNKEQQKNIHEQARTYFGYTNNDQWDNKVKDPARVCFVSYDPDLYINENAVEFKYVEPKKIPKKQVGKLPWIEDDLKRRWANELFDTAFKMIHESTDGNLHDTRVKAGTLLGGGVAHGLFFKDEVLCEMERVISTHTNTPRQALRDVSDGVDYGMKSPLDPPKYLKKKTETANAVIEAVKKETGEEKELESVGYTDFFQLLGNASNSFYVMPNSTGVIARVTEFTKGALLKLAPLAFWEAKYAGEKGGVAWDLAISDCNDESSKKTFDYSLVRGRGVWLDGENSVVNLGGEIESEGDPKKSKWVYTKGLPIGGISDTPLSTGESKKLLDIIEYTPISSSLEKMYLSGAIVQAIICGGLDWRSHTWLTGQAGTGKTWISDKIITPLIGDFALYAKGDATTEAGIRQKLGGDSLAIVHDEAESDSDIGARNMANKLLFSRACSADDRAAVLKGTASGQAMIFSVRSSFIFLSIGVPRLQRADESRISVINLDKSKTAKDQRRFKILQQKQRVLTTEFCDQFRRRAINLLPVIRKNTKTFFDVLTEVLKDSRASEQLASLIACSYSLQSEAVICTDDATLLVCSLDLSEAQASSEKEESDHYSCLEDILSSMVNIGGGQLQTIRELVLGENHVILARYGIKIIKGCICFSRQSTNLQNQLSNSRFSKTYLQELKRVEGVTTKVFKLNGRSTRGFAVPMSEITDSEIVEQQSF